MRDHCERCGVRMRQTIQAGPWTIPQDWHVGRSGRVSGPSELDPEMCERCEVEDFLPACEEAGCA